MDINSGSSDKCVDAKFWKTVEKQNVTIEAVATDLSAAFVSSVMANAPHAALVFDHSM